LIEKRQRLHGGRTASAAADLGCRFSIKATLCRGRTLPLSFVEGPASAARF